MTATKPTSEWVYLDNNATTRIDDRVVDAMLPLLRDNFANPSSIHPLGILAAEALRIARGKVAFLVGAAHDKEIIFTSGATEANCTAILSAVETQSPRSEIVVSSVEHPAVLSLCARLENLGKAKVHRIPVDRDGGLDLDAYSSALGSRTALVSIQWANNETGVIFPITTLAAQAHRAGALFHCDAAQAAGKLPINMRSTQVDMLTLTAHKMHGPKGIGALYVRSGVPLAPLLHGGRQERGRRAGTENTVAIVGFGEAAHLAVQAMPGEIPRIAWLRDRLEREVLRAIPGSLVLGGKNDRIPNTTNIAFEGIEADMILLLLEHAGIAASSGSACSAGSMEPSHVLRAMKVPFSHLRGAVRFSLSRETEEAALARVFDVLPEIARELQSQSLPMEVACD
jgi:cysteine desulfurase